MIDRRGLARRLAAVNIVLSVVAFASVGIGFAFHVRLGRDRAGADLAMAALLWSYLAVTPLLCLGGLLLGDRRTALIRTSYVLLGLWLFAIAWTTTVRM